MIGIGLGLTNRRGGGSSLAIPESGDALFCLTSIDGDNMIDAVNGWEFPITGKDWEDDEWSVTLASLPWKTAATISAPADGTDAATAIQAVDTDNFWYQADGTPNDIPVQAFFQNINFSNKYFCRHVDRSVDANSEETYPPSVTDITLYSSARTIDSTYIDYYGSEVERPTSNVLFVSKDGNDSTGDGTFETPYLTIDKAGEELTESINAIYILSGTYDENSNSLNYLQFDNGFDNAYDFSVTGVGNVVITSPGTTIIVRQQRARTGTFKHLQFDGEDNTTDIWGLNQNGETHTIVNKCLFKGMTNGVSDPDNSNWYQVFEDIIDSVWLGDVVFNLERAYATGHNITGCLFGAIELGNPATILYCKVKGEHTNHITKINKEVEVSYCRFEDYGNMIATSQTTSRTTNAGTLTVKRNKFIHSYNTVSNAMKCLYHRHSDLHHIFEYNYCYSSDENATAYTFQCVDIRYCDENIIQRHNYVEVGSTGIHSLFDIYSMTNISDTILYKSYNNYIISNQQSGVLIGTSENWEQGYLDGSEVYNNYLRGSMYANSDNGGGEHGILLTNGKNMKIYNNRMEYLNLACVYKSNDETNTSGGIYNNYFYNNKVDIYIRRTPYLWVMNNTAIKDSNIVSGDTRQFCKMDYQTNGSVGYSTNNVTIINNIISYENGISGSYSPFYVDDDALVGLDISDNIIYGADTDFFIFNEDGDLEISQADAITSGYASDVDNSDPGITSIPDSPYPATAIDGSTLDAEYDDGFDTDTDWTYPQTVTTKQQTGTWQKGAYVQ